MATKKLKERYREEMVPALQKELDLKNVFSVPKLEKIVINIGAGEASHNAKTMEAIIEQLTLISGQKPVPTKARKSVAGFKIREGMTIGTKVTLRGDRMYDFLAKLVGIVLPRIRDFRGLNPKGFDGRGNYNIGLKEQLVFPEVDYDKIDQARGMNISIITTAENDTQARALLTMLGIPFKKPQVRKTSADAEKKAS